MGPLDQYVSLFRAMAYSVDDGCLYFGQIIGLTQFCQITLEANSHQRSLCRASLLITLEVEGYSHLFIVCWLITCLNMQYFICLLCLFLVCYYMFVDWFLLLSLDA